MRKTLIVLGCMSLGLAHAQQGVTHAQHTDANMRLGINTEKPVASLELRKVTDVPATQVQGFLLPHLTQTERNAFTKEALVNGVMIFNTTKNCIDWWDGAHWQCTDSRFKDEHGEEHAAYRATFSYTATKEFTKQGCPAEQVGSKVSYTPTTPIVGKGSSNISQEDALQKAEANAKAEFERLGQEKANAEGLCQSSYTLKKCLDDVYNDKTKWVVVGYEDERGDRVRMVWRNDGKYDGLAAGSAIAETTMKKGKIYKLVYDDYPYAQMSHYRCPEPGFGDIGDSYGYIGDWRACAAFSDGKDLIYYNGRSTNHYGNGKNGEVVYSHNGTYNFYGIECSEDWQK